MYKIVYTESYVKRAKKFIQRHPEILKQYEKILKLLELDLFHPALRLHKLKGKLSNLYAVSITLSYRIKLDFLLEENKIIPIDIGSHDEVY